MKRRSALVGVALVVVGYGTLTLAFGPTVQRPLSAAGCHEHRFEWTGVDTLASGTELEGNWRCLATGEVVGTSARVGRLSNGSLRAIPHDGTLLPSTVVMVAVGVACEPPARPCCEERYQAVVVAGDLEHVFLCPGGVRDWLWLRDQPAGAHSGYEAAAVTAWAADLMNPIGTLMEIAHRMFGEVGTDYTTSGCS